MARPTHQPGPPGKSDGPHLILAAFGKHPGWDDHIPGIGVQTEGLAHAKQALYVSGIGGQIDSGAWEKLEAEKRLAGFDHSFLWSRALTLMCGRFWSSTDGRGRSKYPMVICVESADKPSGAALAAVGPELEKLRSSCQQTATAEGVNEACRRCQSALDELSSEAGGSQRLGIPGEVRQSFLNHKDLGPERQGLLRVLHEIDRGVGTAGSEADAGMRAFHLRVPLGAETEAGGQLLWFTFLRCVLPANVPILLIARHGAGFLEVLLGEPGTGELFCLQAAPSALPLATEIPYEIEPQLKARLARIEEAFLSDDARPRAVDKPASDSSSRSSQPHQGASPGAAGKSGSGKWMVLGAVAIILVVIALVAILRGGDGSQAPSVPEPERPVVSPQATKDANDDSASLSNANQVVQQEEDDFQKALREGRSALEQDDLERTIQMAERALVLKPNNSSAAKLKADAKVKLADAERLAEIEKKCQTAVAAGRKAFEAGQFTAAAAHAEEALRLKPADSVAVKLKRDAEAEMARAASAAEKQRLYQEAMNAGREAVTTRQWQVALQQANVALEQKPNDAAATKLKADAEGNMASQAAAAEKTRLYQAAITAGQGALAQGQWQTALDQADKALAQKSGDAVATKLKADAQARILEASDLAEAQTRFAQGDYAEALNLCGRHATAEAFLALRSKAEDEQSVLNTARRKFAAGDYSLIDDLQAKNYAGKAPFQELVVDARAEKKELAGLKMLRGQDSWSALLGRWATLRNETRAKPPFVELKDWAQPRADKERDGDKLAGLDATLQKFLVWFNILKPSDPKVTSKDARDAKPLPPKSLSLDQRQKYLSYVRRLEAEYQAGGWINQAGRQEHLAELEERIPSW